MIQLSLDQYNHPANRLTVEQDYETGSINVTFEMYPGEGTGNWHRLDPELEKYATDALTQRGSVYGNFGAEILRYQAEATANKEAAGDLTRGLTPSEARELAAALVHYASEIEARR